MARNYRNFLLTGAIEKLDGMIVELGTVQSELGNNGDVSLSLDVLEVATAVISLKDRLEREIEK